ncbi:MAG TPA: pitrilysin family protein [Candidatus Omnitrophota bacterium]|nr:pitrilysin family protein [Candidatus Omnitrophota bacterium]
MSRPLFAALIGLVLLAVAPARAVTVEKVVSPGGIEAWLVQDHSNPIIAMEVSFQGGASVEPAAKAGLANMVSGLLDEGAGPFDSQTFQGKLEDLAIGLSFDAGKDSFRGHLKTLTDNRDTAFDLFRLALSQPRFDKEPVERIRGQIQAMLKRELQDPNSVAAREWFRLAFAGHPYASPVRGNPETVKAITVADLRDWTKKHIARDTMIVGVVGDIAPAELGQLLDKTFGALPAKAAPIAVEGTTPKAPGKVAVIERNNPQSVAVFGEGGIKRDDPDWYAAYVMNYILGGGGFSSRLTEQVREKRGLAYSVYSYLQPFDRAGIIFGGVATENARLAESLALIREEWRRMREEGPTEKELADAKTYLTGSFPLSLDSTASIAGLLVAMQEDKLGIDYLDKRNSYIEAVSLDHVKKVAARLLDPDRLTVVVVGKPDGVQASAVQ